MSLQKYLLIILSIFMQYIPIDAKNETYETNMHDQIEECNNDDGDKDKDDNNNIKYLLIAAGVLTVSGFVYWNQSSLKDMVTKLFGGPVNEDGRFIINSQKAIAIMNKNKSLQNAHYSLTGGARMRGGKIESGTLADGSYFTANGVDYIVQN